jgi:hypothetical protein
MKKLLIATSLALSLVGAAAIACEGDGTTAQKNSEPAKKKEARAKKESPDKKDTATKS